MIRLNTRNGRGGTIHDGTDGHFIQHWAECVCVHVISWSGRIVMAKMKLTLICFMRATASTAAGGKTKHADWLTLHRAQRRRNLISEHWTTGRECFRDSLSGVKLSLEYCVIFVKEIAVNKVKSRVNETSNSINELIYNLSSIHSTITTTSSTTLIELQ